MVFAQKSRAGEAMTCPSETMRVNSASSLTCHSSLVSLSATKRVQSSTLFACGSPLATPWVKPDPKLVASEGVAALAAATPPSLKSLRRDKVGAAVGEAGGSVLIMAMHYLARIATL